MNVQATSCKKCFQMTPFCLIFQLGHKKRGAVTSPALITDRVGKPITCCGERIVASDDDKPSCKHSQVRHGNPCNGVAFTQRQNKKCKKNSNQSIPALPPACSKHGPGYLPNNTELLSSLWHMSTLRQEKQPKRPDSTRRPTLELNFFEDWSWEYPLLASETFRVKKENEKARQNAAFKSHRQECKLVDR